MSDFLGALDQLGSESVIPKSDVVSLMVDGVPYRTLPRLLLLERSIFAGRYAMTVEPTAEDRKVRRVLDIGAGCGAFALYAAARWEGCWVDCYEPDPEARALLEENGPAGMRIVGEIPSALSVYQVVRWNGEALEDLQEFCSKSCLHIVDYQWRADT